MAEPQDSAANNPREPGLRFSSLADTDAPPSSAATSEEVADLSRRVADLQRQERTLKREIESLKESREALFQRQTEEAQRLLSKLLQEGVSDLEQRRKTLQVAVDQLERRQERIRAEMRTTFAGVSQDLAIRVQGFKDYLVGSLQDLATAAEQLNLTPPAAPSPAATPAPPPTTGMADTLPDLDAPTNLEAGAPGFAKRAFDDETARIRQIIDQYRTIPDYYGPPWQLRRTFEPIHAERVSKWFFEQGGRGALRTMGSRLQNILIASATISILRSLYGSRVRALILGDSPERLGEWRRGLQDCLGISRGDFGSQQGVVLFEAPEAVAQRADRLVAQNQLPFIVIDEAEEKINLSLLQFPLWLAFAPDPSEPPPVFY
ncbi:MAG: DUF3086 domain-containing protein [Synechococcales bacterium]|nr:DUF3086 domain-containing protein [Synechococcales bacterium]